MMKSYSPNQKKKTSPKHNSISDLDENGNDSNKATVKLNRNSYKAQAHFYSFETVSL